MASLVSKAPRAVAALLAGMLALSAYGPARAQEAPSDAVPLHATQSWTLAHDPEGNPFDVLATATFEHEDSGERVSTELFWMGDGTYAFRFTPTRTGRWRYETRSDVAALGGVAGELQVEPSDLLGALSAAGTKFAFTADGGFRGALHHPYRVGDAGELHTYGSDLGAARDRIDEVLDTVRAQGFRSVFFSLQHAVLELGARAYDDHESENPDLDAFAILDLLLQEAHARRMTVHFWLWGDEERRQTPAGLAGGVNGEVDRRLQRYLAARLGPLPGWTMAYGFDLEEWAEPDDVRDWAGYLQGRMQLPHLLTAREKNPRGGFALRDDKLALFSVDDRMADANRTCYDAAVARLTEQDGHDPPVPVLFERRFLYLRDDWWTEERTRRCLWQLTLAGGAGAVWGQAFSDPQPYPTPAYYETFFAFWEDRFLLELERADAPQGSWALATPDGSRMVVYAEDADGLDLDLSGLPGPAPVVAVDTRTGRAYDLGTLDPEAYAWTAPARSDWAVAVGVF